jgi:hypothetical protein
VSGVVRNEFEENSGFLQLIEEVIVAAKCGTAHSRLRANLTIQS